MHVTLDGNAHPPFLNTLRKNIRKIKALGLEVYIAELDIGIGNSSLDVQKDWYYDIYKTCIEEGVKIIKTWVFVDDVDRGWRYGQQCCPFCNDYTPKSAYYGIQQALIDLSTVKK